nr:hypothetical protein Iba_chr04aCG7000 [Ipomoea batatas]
MSNTNQVTCADKEAPAPSGPISSADHSSRGSNLVFFIRADFAEFSKKDMVELTCQRWWHDFNKFPNGYQFLLEEESYGAQLRRTLMLFTTQPRIANLKLVKRSASARGTGGRRPGLFDAKKAAQLDKSRGPRRCDTLNSKEGSEDRRLVKDKSGSINWLPPSHLPLLPSNLSQEDCKLQSSLQRVRKKIVAEIGLGRGRGNLRALAKAWDSVALPVPGWPFIANDELASFLGFWFILIHLGNQSTGEKLMMKKSQYLNMVDK